MKEESEGMEGNKNGLGVGWIYETRGNTYDD